MSDGPRPWQLLDAGFARLAASGYRDAAWFYAGALPFCTAFLWAWTRFASRHATSAAYLQAGLLLSLLYTWKSYCSCRFLERLLPAPSTSSATLRGLQAAGAGALWLLACLASLLALFWSTATVYVAAAYFPLELRAADAPRPLRTAVAGAFRASFDWYLEQQLFALHCLLIAGVVAANLALTAVAAPQLLARLLGLRTLWADIPVSRLLLNSGLWVALVLLTYLLLGPAVQAAIVVSYEHQRSRRTGDDLRLELERLERLQAAASVIEEIAG